MGEPLDYQRCVTGVPFRGGLAACSSDALRTIAAYCAVDGYGFLTGDADLSAHSVNAVDKPFTLPMHSGQFWVDISAKAREAADAPTLEATAATLAMRRLTRSVKAHARRLDGPHARTQEGPQFERRFQSTISEDRSAGLDYGH